MFDRRVKCSVTEHAGGRGAAEDSADYAAAVSPVIFVVVLGHVGVDLHGVVATVLITVCVQRWLHDAGSWSRLEWSMELGCSMPVG